MQVDDKARNFLAKAKQAGISKEEAFKTLQSKGYQLPGMQQPVQPQPAAQPQAQDGLLGNVQDLKDFGGAALGGAADALTFGYLPEIASAIRGTSAEQEQKTMQGVQGKSMAGNLVGQVAGMVAPGALISKGVQAAARAPKVAQALGKTGWLGRSLQSGGAAAGGLAGGVEQSLMKEGDTGLGIVGGGVLGPAFGKIADVAGKSGLKVASKLGNKRAGKLLNALKSTPDDISRHMADDKKVKTLIQGIDANEKVAGVIQQRADDAIVDTANRVEDVISKKSGLGNINKLADESRKNYASYMKTNASKVMPEESFSKISQNPEIASMIKKVKAVTPELRGLSDSSLPVLQRTNSILMEGAASIGDRAKSRLQKSSAQELRSAMSKSFPDFDDMQKQYSKSVGVEKFLNDFSEMKGQETSNFGKKLLTEQNKRSLKSALGEDRGNQVIEGLRKESKGYDNLKSVLTKARNRSQDRGSLSHMTQQLGKMGLGAAAGFGAAGAGGVDPTTGALLGGAALGSGALRNALRKRAAKGLLNKPAQQLIGPTYKTMLGAIGGGLM